MGFFKRLLTIDKSPLENQKKDDIKQRLLECNLEEKKRDAVFDGVYPCASKDGRSIRKIAYNEYKACLLHNLVLYSKIIRNCELIDDKEFKKQHLTNSIESWAKFMLLMISVGRDLLSKTKIHDRGSGKVILDLSDPKNKNLLNWTVSIIIPLCVYNYIQQSGSSEKLENIILENINENESVIIKFILELLYIDMQLPDYLERLKNLIKNFSKQRYFLELLYQKLGVFIMMKPMATEDVNIIAELIADTYIKLRPGQKFNKGKIISDLKSERILLEARKAI